MATTETKTGFRLPWSQDHTETDQPSGDGGAAGVASDAAPAQTGADPSASQETERPDMIDATTAATTDATEAAAAPADAWSTPAEPVAAASPEPAVAPAASRKPNKLMADLAKAMQSAAEGARSETLEKFAADAKTHIEAIQTGSATEAADLRRQADDDIAGIRDWSKAEIAKIREETEQRITGRKTGLDGELDDHSASTERRIARVQARVDAFEAEMAYFFEVLLAEEDPTKLAAMAQSLPEPPDFDDEIADPAPVAETSEPSTDQAATADASAVADGPVQSPADLEAALEAIAAAAQAADVAEAAEAAAQAEEEALRAEAEAGIGIADVARVGVSAEDPRMAVLGLTPGAAAEAEAASFSDDDIPTIGDDALAARIAGLIPDAHAAAASSLSGPETVSTRVIVVGLVSVASIAGFKRHLGRVAGVQSVGVSSGPDGEFVFVVTHGPDVPLREAIATLPGFGARVTGGSDEGIQVTAKDPETES